MPAKKQKPRMTTADTYISTERIKTCQQRMARIVSMPGGEIYLPTFKRLTHELQARESDQAFLKLAQEVANQST